MAYFSLPSFHGMLVGRPYSRAKKRDYFIIKVTFKSNKLLIENITIKAKDFYPGPKPKYEYLVTCH